MATAKVTKLKQIYQLKITLKGSKPPIWRRVQVVSNIKLPILHRIIQVVMGWHDYHLHQFIIGGTYYSEPDDEFDSMDTENESKFKLDQLITREKQKFIYEYDFGDSWEHEIVLEKILSPEQGVVYPLCIKGVRACPPEDCGGIWGYEELLEALATPDESNAELLEWVGEDFDPEEFDLDNINMQLKHFD